MNHFIPTSNRQSSCFPISFSTYSAYLLMGICMMIMSPHYAQAFSGILNGEFEASIANWNTGPNTSVGYNNPLYVAQGNYSVWIARTSSSGATASIYQDVGVQGDYVYTLSFWAGTHNPNFVQMVSIEFYDKANQSLGSTSVEVNHNVHPTDLLALYTIQATAPSNADYVRIEGTATGDYLKLDDMVMTEDAPSSFPVEWLDFTVTREEDGVQVAWVTASELNSSYFEVERSDDGIAYETLEQIDAAGTSQFVNEYSYTDNTTEELNAQKVFYRLRQVDLDGSYSYSNVIELGLAQQQILNIKAYPNPIADMLTVELEWSAEAQQMHISNMQGQILYQRVLDAENGATAYHVETTQWPSGIYFVSLIGAKSVETHKIAKR